MPRFRVDFVHEGEEEIRSREVDFRTGTEPMTLFRQLREWEGEYYDQHNEQLVEVRSIVALEDLPEFGVESGAVVWRDWGEFDMDSPQSVQAAQVAQKEFIPVWDDKGLDYSFFLELLYIATNPDESLDPYYRLSI